MSVKLHTEYSSVLHMPVLKEIAREKGSHNAIDSYGHKQYLQNQGMGIISILSSCRKLSVSVHHLITSSFIIEFHIQ